MKRRRRGDTIVYCLNLSLNPFSANACAFQRTVAQMTILRNISRLILQQSSPSSTPRWLSTATEVASSSSAAAAAQQPRKKGFLFYQVVRAESKSKIADVLNKWVNKGNEVKRYDIVNLSTYFRRHKKFQAAIKLYEWMESRKYELNNADQAVRIDLLCKTDGIASAESYFNGLQESQKTSKTYGALLGCYCREKMFDKALQIFEETKALNYASTLNYNNLMSLYYNSDKPEKVFHLAQEMEEKNIAPDCYTYNILINSYASLDNLDAIDGVVEKMKSNNVGCDSFTYGNLATIYFNKGLHDKARYFLEMMEKMENQPYEQVFEGCRTRIKLYAEMNDLSGVIRAWEALKEASSTPNNTSYLFMFLALSKMEEHEKLEKLFKEWGEGCSAYDFRLPNVLLEYYLSHDMIDEATSVFEGAKSKGRPNLRTLDLFATLCVKRGEIDLALEYLEKGFHKADRNGKWFPTDKTIKLFVEYFEGKDDEKKERFMECMKKADLLDRLQFFLAKEDAGS